jgi:ribose 5-phosphate isomerase RpiB
MFLGIAADHGGIASKEQLDNVLCGAGHEIVDFSGGYRAAPASSAPMCSVAPPIPA